jgi:isopentenyl-diphosphate delta-isomerase
MDVILVNENDEPIGTMGKMEVHEKALLHRAFSVFIFNIKGEMLLQQRAADKYHSPGLWTNTCCSHPRPGEDTHAAALKRLQEEMGFTTPIEKAFHFIYKAPFDNELTEHEFDHVFFGYCDQQPYINLEEVESYLWMDVIKIIDEIKVLLESF